MDEVSENLEGLLPSLERVGVHRHLVEGETLITQGRHEEQIYVLLSGRLSVTQDGILRREILAPDLVGEYAFLDNRPRTASVTALTAAKVLEIDRSALVGCANSDLGIVTRFLSLAVERMKARQLDPGRSDLDAFLEECLGEALSHPAVTHPYLNAMASGDLPDVSWALADFARHYHAYSSHFPRYLTQTISKMAKPEHRRSLMENLLEEQGRYADEDLEELSRVGIEAEWIVGIPHPELFRRFCDALDVPLNNIDEDSNTVTCWREMFIDVLGQGSPAQAVGALGLGTESIVSRLYQKLLPALERAGLEPRDAVFFPLHATVDDHHQEALLAIARDLADSQEGRTDLRKGMRKALFLRAGFWDWMLRRAQDPGGVRAAEA